MKDNTGDSIEVEPYPEATGAISLRVQDTGGQRVETAVAMLSAKKARKLARKLIAAADELDGVKPGTDGPRFPVGVSIAELSARQVTRQIRRRLDEVEAEQRWDREQITVLLADFGTRLPAPAEEPTANARPVDDRVHYLLPAEWIVDRTRNFNTSKSGSVTFEIPAGQRLNDRISTGFDR